LQKLKYSPSWSRPLGALKTPSALQPGWLQTDAVASGVGAGAFLREDFTRIRSKRGELRSMIETFGADSHDGKRLFEA
jgi:hypothetical protein